METIATRKKFEIINSDPPYQPREQVVPSFRIIEGRGSNYENGADNNHRLYLTQEAIGHIHSHIGWKEVTPHNCIEQGGILLGEAFRDSARGVTYGIVRAAVAGLSARGSSVHLEMTHDTWREMLDSADRLLEQSPHRELHVIGWYHTHPNGLDVYMSGTDRDTQRRMFAQDWQFAIVLNPQKQRWRAFFGRDAEECRGYVIADEEGEHAGANPFVPDSRDEQPYDFDTLAESYHDAQDNDTPRGGSPLRERLLAWASTPERLLWTCLAALLLVLILQCLSVGMQVVDLIFKR